MDRLAINNISKLEQLEEEREFEKASSLYLKLRKQAQEDSYYSDISGLLIWIKSVPRKFKYIV